jgi:membrane protease YdiL (CAAX protease family)
MSSLPPPGAAPPNGVPRMTPLEPPPGGPAPDGGPQDDGASEQPPWRIWTAPAAIVLGLALGVFGSLIVQGIGAAGGSSFGHPSPAVTIISDVVFDLSFVAAALYFAVLQAHARPTDFGFRRISLRTGATAVVSAGLSYYVLTAIWASVFKLHGNDKLPSELGVSRSTAALVAAAVFVCVIAPIAEEFFFRGFIFGALRRWHVVVAGRDIGIWLAAIVTGILFGLAHTGSASPQYLVPLGFLGFVLCIVRWKTGSLYACMALHSINNSLALGVNQLSWNAAEILGLMVAALAVIGAITLPLAARKRAVPSPI